MLALTNNGARKHRRGVKRNRRIISALLDSLFLHRLKMKKPRSRPGPFVVLERSARAPALPQKNYFFLVVSLATEVAAAKLASASSVACLAALLMLS